MNEQVEVNIYHEAEDLLVELRDVLLDERGCCGGNVRSITPSACIQVTLYQSSATSSDRHMAPLSLFVQYPHLLSSSKLPVCANIVYHFNVYPHA